MADGDLLERTEQQAAIDSALTDARRGEGHVLVIEGAAGIGKSRLLQELRDAAGPSMRVLYARASELERGFAFGVVRQLFEGIVRDPALGPIALDGAAVSARDVFEETPGQERGASFALLHGLHWLAVNLAEAQPLVLAVDDLHWCDPSSLRFLAYLGRRLEGTPTLIAATTRPVPPAAADADLIGELLSDPLAVHLYPQALSEQGTKLLLASQFDGAVDDAFAVACFKATGGNPLMLRQLARSLQAEGTAPTQSNADSVHRAAHRALARTVLARVGRYSTQAIELSRAVAVLGDNATIAQIAGLSGLTEDEVATAWGELVDAEVLRRDQLSFVHALVRDAIYFDVPEPGRIALHARAARVLDAAGATPERVASQLAFTPASGDEWALDIAIRAGDAALSRGAPDAAAAHLRRALLEPPPTRELRAEVMTKLAAAAYDVNAAEAIRVLDDVIPLIDDPRNRGEAQLWLVQALALTDQWDRAAQICRDAGRALSDEEDDLRAAFLAVRAVTALFGADDPEALNTISQHRVLADDASLGHHLQAGLAALIWAYEGGTAADCTALAHKALARDASIFRRHTLVSVSPLYLLAVGDYPGSLEIWDRIRADAHRSGSPILHLNLDMWLGVTQLRRGDLLAAVEGISTAMGIGHTWGTGKEGMRYHQAHLGEALVEQGELARAREVLDPGRPDPASETLGALLWWKAQTALLLAEGKSDEALAASQTLARRAAWMTSPVGVDHRPLMATALLRVGDQEAAEQVARDGLRTAEIWGAPGAVGAALRVLGEVRGAAGLDDLRRSVEVLDGSVSRLELAKSLLAYGAAVRRDRQPKDAREPLERAYELAGACGSASLVELARTELAATGVRRRPADASGPDSLTPSERRVADLAAAGRSNREIAQELFVTPKTVEVHLSATYRKLGIGSRHALPSALAGAA